MNELKNALPTNSEEKTTIRTLKKENRRLRNQIRGFGMLKNMLDTHPKFCSGKLCEIGQLLIPETDGQRNKEAREALILLLKHTFASPFVGCRDIAHEVLSNGLKFLKENRIFPVVLDDERVQGEGALLLSRITDKERKRIHAQIERFNAKSEGDRSALIAEIENALNPFFLTSEESNE